MNKVAIYCRVDSGGDSASLQRAATMQKTRLEQFAAANKYVVVDCYEDIGYTGYDMSRPGLLALESDYNKGQFDAVLVANRSRLYRGYVWNACNRLFPIISLTER